jgi:hypothetical protein
VIGHALARWLLRGVAGAAALCGLLFGWLAFDESRYPYNDLGRYFDGLSVHLEQDVEVYTFIAVAASLIAVLTFRAARVCGTGRRRTQEIR